MVIQLIDICDVKGRAIQTELLVPEVSGSNDVLVRFQVAFGAGGSHYLSTVLEVAATYADDSRFELTDGFDGTQNTYIPTRQVRLLARSAMHALPRTVGALTPFVKFAATDPSLPF